MNHLVVLAVLLSGLGQSALATADSTEPLADRLDRTAALSPLAGQSLLTDIQQVGNHLLMVGASGHVLRQGATGIEQAKVPVDLLLTAVHFVDERQGWAVGHDGVVLHSIDGGLTWERQLEGSANARLMLDWARAEVRRLQDASQVAGEDDRLATALEDARFAEDDAMAGIESGPSRPLLDLWFRSADEGWVVGAYGTILHTGDGGRSWAFVPGLDNPERLHLNAVLGLADGSLLVAGEGGRLYRRTGEVWQPVQQPTQASFYKLLQLADGRVLAMGFAGALFESLDQGRSWQAIAVPVKTSLYGAEQLPDGSLLFSAGNGLLLHSQDLKHFRTWQGKHKAPWLASALGSNGQLAVVGSAGLQMLSMDEFKESLQ
ncbi:WD40/YVTN/BNR-like repeat-containing protein [Pseudomonas sp. NPDC090755]|uniref:WD40/YVTN/BNR-like repeat-containing protein n=1 Tax=Pseudomonas sp. NPDC090755 TaxID=3364481 RepID=UPI00383A919E